MQFNEAAANDDDEVPNEVMDLLQLSTHNGLCGLIDALARGGGLIPEAIEAIYQRMAAPLDHAELASEPTLAFLRTELEECFAEARIAAQILRRP